MSSDPASVIETQKLRLWTHRLKEEYQQIRFTFNLKLKMPVILIEELSGRWGAWDSETRTLSLSKRLIEQHPWEIVLEIFKHEIAHQIVTDLEDDGGIHGPAFQKACDRIGVAPWARRAETETLPPQKSLETDQCSPEEKRLLERAEKLLSLATSDNEHEALLAMQKVQELYAKYHLTRIQEKRGAHWGYLMLPLQKKRVERYQSVIASLLNDYFFVEVIHTALYDAEACEEFKALELLGTRENVLMAEYVFCFLEQQLKGLWETYQKGKKLGVASKNSFFLGVLEGFRTKLQSLPSTPTGSMALALRQDPGLETLVKSRYPKLNRLRGSRRLHDSRAYDAGKKEGHALVIRKGISKKEGNQKKLLRSS